MIYITQTFQVAICTRSIHTNQQILEYVTLVVDTTCITVQIGAYDNTLLILVSATDRVTRYLVATSDTNLVLL